MDRRYKINLLNFLIFYPILLIIQSCGFFESEDIKIERSFGDIVVIQNLNTTNKTFRVAKDMGDNSYVIIKNNCTDIFYNKESLIFITENKYYSIFFNPKSVEKFVKREININEYLTYSKSMNSIVDSPLYED